MFCPDFLRCVVNLVLAMEPDLCYNIAEGYHRSHCAPRETGFYYLQSRYYDPSIGRFINADSLASTGQGFLGYNMFAYCGNNPSSFIDDLGTNCKHLFEEKYINDSGDDAWYRPISNEAPSEFAIKCDQEIYDFMSLNWLDKEDVIGANKLRSGNAHIKRGFGLIYAPSPSPVDEIAGIILIIWGSISMISGTGDLIKE